MTLEELKVLVDAELERRPASGLSDVTIEIDCGDVGHSVELLGVSEVYRNVFSLKAGPVDCCGVLGEWQADAGRVTRSTSAAEARTCDKCGGPHLACECCTTAPPAAKG